MGNDKITMTGTADNLKEMQAKGSSSNDDFMEFRKTFNPYCARLNTVTQLANSPGGVKSKDSLFKVFKSVADTVQTQLDLFIQTRKSSYVSPFVLVVLSQLSDDVIKQEKSLNSLSPEVQKGYNGQYLQNQIPDTKIAAVVTTALAFPPNHTHA